MDTISTKRKISVKKLLAIMQIMYYVRFVMIKRIVKNAERMLYLIKLNVFAKKAIT